MRLKYHFEGVINKVTQQFLINRFQKIIDSDKDGINNSILIVNPINWGWNYRGVPSTYSNLIHIRLIVQISFLLHTFLQSTIKKTNFKNFFENAQRQF